MTKRVNNWQSRLQACLAERRALPFAWGSNDCAFYAADAVLACTGMDPAADLRGTYADVRGAAEVIREHGGLITLAATRLGAEVQPAFAQPGDVGLAVQQGRSLLAVFGGEAWHAPGEAGEVVLPTALIARAWRCCKE